MQFGVRDRRVRARRAGVVVHVGNGDGLDGALFVVAALFRRGGALWPPLLPLAQTRVGVTVHPTRKREEGREREQSRTHADTRKQTEKPKNWNALTRSPAQARAHSTEQVAYSELTRTTLWLIQN